MKRIAVLGSTGSIGQQTLDVVRAHPGRFQIIGLAAGNNTDLLSKQIGEFKPKLVSCASNSLPAGAGYKLVSPEEIAAYPDADIVVMATSGKAGLSPTLEAIKAGKTIALSNKEVLVMAGEIIIKLAKTHNARIIPVDSEHSAIWQCMKGEPIRVSRIILTASGGPFLKYSPVQMESVTVEQALNHPSWKMGKKVTIDSATLMNKGLEVIEAHWLFHASYDNIEILIHPQSIIHSMVEFADGAMKAQLSIPDMRFPIQYALSYPQRLPNPGLPQLDWSKVSSLTFQEPDLNKFPCLKLAIEAGRKGGTYPSVLCGADETAVELFLSGRIKFGDIARLVEGSLEKHKPIANPTLEEIVAADEWARDRVIQFKSGGTWR